MELIAKVFSGLAPFDMVECCGIGVMDVTGQICCDNMIVDNEYGDDGECCNDVAINITESICCQNTPHFISGNDEVACCGTTNAGKSWSVMIRTMK